MKVLNTVNIMLGTLNIAIFISSLFAEVTCWGNLAVGVFCIAVGAYGV